MTESEAFAVYIGLFLLRCIAPLALTLIVGYFMNRLVDRWRAVDEQMLEEYLKSEPDMAAAPVITLPAITVPCWIMRNCTPEMKADCPAYKQPGLPCWLVKLSSEGNITDDCPDCPIYTDALAPAAYRLA